MRRVGVPLLAISASLGVGCGESTETPEAVRAVHSSVIDYFDCPVNEGVIEVSDLADESLAAFGDETIGRAMTNEKGITLDDDLSEKKMAELVIHETIHYCADRTTPNVLETPIEIPEVGMLTAIDGFVPYLNGQNGNGNTFVEEGVTEWLSFEFDEYTGHEDYAELSELTEQIALVRGFEKKDIMDLLKTDDLIGYVALITNKPADQVNGQDIRKVIVLYIDTYDTKYVPTVSELTEILNN